MNTPEQHIITSLLEKHALGICTPEERVLLEQWYAAFPEKGQLWRDASEKAAMKDTLKDGIFEVIAPQKVHYITEVPVKIARRIWWQAAAVIAVLVGSYLLYHQFSHKEKPAYVVVSAAAGKGIVKVELPDRSEVWLEPGTTVRYRKDFGNTAREIELADGMAFFSVRKHAHQPFLVKAPGGVQTKVLGTEFTVKAYTQSKVVQVMVSSGIVQVSDSLGILDTLTANQQLSYRQQTHIAMRTEGKQEDWRSGNLALNNASFAEVARILENRYGLQVAYNAAAVASYRFTLHIGKQAIVAEVLDMLKDISGLEFTLSENRVTVH